MGIWTPLAEADSDAGPLGEFVVLLSKLGRRTAGYGFRTRRSEKAPWNLEIDGETIEVKTTFKPKPTPRGKPRRRWTVGEERDSLEGKGPLAGSGSSRQSLLHHIRKA